MEPEIEDAMMVDPDFSYTLYADEAHDVSIELSADATEALLDAIANIIVEELYESHGIDREALHLLQRLNESFVQTMPWDDDVEQTLDLVLYENDYAILTRAVGDAFGNMLAPDSGDKYFELIDAIESIQEQMLDSEPDEAPIPEPENGTFCAFIHDGDVAVYENEQTGDKWYYCTGCEWTYSEISDDHECVTSLP